MSRILPPVPHARRTWDRIGLSLAGLCTAHCLLVPLVCAVVPAWTAAQTLDVWVHPLVAALATPVALLAFRTGCGTPKARVLLGVGLLLVLGALPAGHGTAHLMTLVGSSLMAAGHLLQHRNTCSTSNDIHEFT